MRDNSKYYSISMSCCSNSLTDLSSSIFAYVGGIYGLKNTNHQTMALCVITPLVCANTTPTPYIYSATCTMNHSRMSSSVILTSGTLSPLDSFATEFGSDFPVRVEAPHVIDVYKQCLVMGISSMGGIGLDGKYKNQQEEQYQVNIEHFK